MKCLREVLLDGFWPSVVCLVFFCSGVFSGMLSFDLVREQFEPVVRTVFSGVMVEGGDFETIVNIFLRNVWASSVLLVTGFFLLPAFILLFSNGFVVGFVVALGLENGLSAGRLVLGVVPHGVFEIPAILLSAAFGMKVGLKALFPRGEGRLSSVSQGIREASLVYLTTVVPLLAVGAVVEVLVSKRLVV